MAGQFGIPHKYPKQPGAFFSFFRWQPNNWEKDNIGKMGPITSF